MNIDFALEIIPALRKADFAAALEIAEGHLKEIERTPFHAILGRSLLHQVNSLVDWTGHFVASIVPRMDVKALYLEMNEFDINTQAWLIDGFAYSRDGGPDELDWLSGFTRDTLTKENFILRGYEKLQQAFENEELTTKALQDARDWCGQIIISRYMELVHAAHLEAKKINLGWARIPVYATGHAYDFVFLSAP